MEFKEALEAAQKGKLISTGANDRWAKKVGDYWHDEKGNQINWIPEVYISDTWRVRKEDIYIWASCDSDGLSVISSKEDDVTLIFGEHRRPCSNLENNLFPKDKPQKYKLVPVEE